MQTAYSVTQAGYTTFSDVQTSAKTKSQITVSSNFIANEFVGAAALCTSSAVSAVSACALLANLCVLQTFSESTPACTAYQKVAKARGALSTSSFTDWPNEMPWLYYGLLNSQSASTITSKAVDVYVSFSSQPVSPEVNSLPIYLATYTLNGTYLGLRLFSTEANMCSSSERNSQLVMGDNTVQSCSLDLSQFNSSSATLFYDPYILQADGSLYPIPVRVTNYARNGAAVNLDSASSASYQFTRRFILMDTVSGSTTTSGGNPNVVSYASSISVLVTKQPDVAGMILVPQISVQYEQRDVSALGWNATLASLPNFTFSASYVMVYDTFWRVVVILFAIVSLLAAISWLYVSYSWNRRNYLPTETMDVSFLFNVCLTGAGSFANFYFVLLFGVSLYWLIFYKGQTVVYVLIPSSTSSTEISTFNSLLAAAFSLQAVYVILRLYRQCCTSFFFVDWERPRHLLTAGNGLPQAVLPASIAQAAEPDSTSPIKPHPTVKLAPVSMWRSIKMITRWRELQTHRRVNVHWTLFWMVFILIGCKVRYVATPQPDASDLSTGSTNPVLLFGMNTSVWLCLVVVQLLYKYLIHDRYIHHALLSFVDSLSVANVSLIIFSDRFHGYYVHGKSVHGFADVDLAHMNESLVKEEHDQVALRGLEGTADQIYEIYVTKQFQELYSKVNSLVSSREDQKRAKMISRIALKNQPTKPIATNAEALRAAESVNKFLCSLIDKSFKDYNYNIRARIWTEKYLSLFPDLTQGSIFYIESSPVFNDVLLAGAEYVILVFLILSYNLVDCYADNPTLATLITFLIDFVIVQTRKYYGLTNISKRTLIDKKYLF